MRTKLFFAIFLAFSNLYANATFNPSSPIARCLACEIPGGLSVSDLTGASATLSWNAVVGATQYTIEVQDEQVNPSVFQLETNVVGTSYAVTGLTAGVLYKFKVRTRCGGDKSDWSDWSFFNGNFGGGIGGGNGNCSRPTSTQIANITANSAILTWTAVPGVASYFLEIEREQGGAAPWQITQTVTANSFVLTGLNADTKYKFKVRSNCAGGGHSNWTKWRKFKTAPSFTGTSGGSNLNPSSNREDLQPVSTSALEIQVWPNPAQSSTTVRLQNLSAGT
ncbi:MAG: fibronectin type III domain-containing protein, partial [Saprospiraceae bacterium]|nr:fibronectin type III domain-containing protein [Saprospiraceae bacterium]